MSTLNKPIDYSRVQEILHKGSRKIAPLWSLENFVAVNPYLGMADMKFEDAMDFLDKSGKVSATLPTKFYLDALRNGEITEDDLKKALEESQLNKTVKAFLRKLYSLEDLQDNYQVPVLTEITSEVTGKKWLRFMVDRISFWASAYFDDKQATWKTSISNNSLFTAWKKEAEIDYSTEAMGLTGFRKKIKALPDNYVDAASQALTALEIPESLLPHYLNGLLMKMNGWAGFAARIDWDAGLEGKESHALEEFLAILLVWEMSIKELLATKGTKMAWDQSMVEAEIMISSNLKNEKLAHQLVLQEAFDIANQRKIIQKINKQKAPVKTKKKTVAQAIFCIDVRSELYRRNLEAANPQIETMGFAGFFAFPIKYVPLGHTEGSNQCPVLLTTSHTIKEGLNTSSEEERAVSGRTLKAHVLKAWKSFKSGAISCFSFVSPLGIFYLPKLYTDLFGFTRPIPHPDKAGLTKDQFSNRSVRLDQGNLEVSGIPEEDRIQMAASALKAMSLTEDFAPVVLIVGHGASTVNNPHATGLDCGACGGQSGEANAKVAAAVLNDAKVREGLSHLGITIPEETVFIAALHDTTTDVVKTFKTGELPEGRQQEITEIESSLKIAGELARNERADRMNITRGDFGKKIIERSKDWSQVRPEWGLAGCSSFIVAPRERTSQLSFGGKAFMHSYQWQKDQDFKVLELIMTAPMVVTSWINLQYYASTVDNKKFGSGNKTLHNVVGGLGVLEGFAGDLRVGLPWQSVHDGKNFQHEPQRLNVIIEAPVDEMSKILKKHDSIRQLCDNKWIYLFAMNEKGKVAYKYLRDLEWEVVG